MQDRQELYHQKRREFREEFNKMRTEIEELELKVSSTQIELAKEKHRSNVLYNKIQWRVYKLNEVARQI